MAGFVKKAYIAILAVFAVLMVYYFAAYHNQLEAGSEQAGYEILEPMEVLEKHGTDSGEGDSVVIRLKLDNVSGSYCTLMFYSIHKRVSVYYGFDCIYSMKPAKKNSFTKTPGCVWNCITLDESMRGKEIRIELTSVYPGISYGLPVIYLGERGPIAKVLMKKELFPLVTSAVLVLIGSLFVGYVLYNIKNSEVDKNLGMLGLFAILTGLWKISDLSVIKFWFNGFPIFSVLPFIALLMVVIPCVFFLMELHSTRDQQIWLVPCWVSIGVIYITLLLQYFNLADFRQIFPLMLAVIAIAVVVVARMVFVEFRKVGWNTKLRRNLMGFSIILIGVMMDVSRYFISGGRQTSYFAILGFLIYTILLGYLIVKESGALIVAGEGAQSFENMAYHDKMTGCFNRSAFIVDTDPYDVDPKDYVVAVLDLNNLKQCNDTLGHERGDAYIRESARLIQSIFGKLGKCYRMGGDEFYCLIPKGGLAACREQKAELDKLVEEFNAGSSDIHMGIACGFARYDRRMDYDLNATAKRADKEMYANKEAMKKKQNV